jgi:hypothetical protein
VAVVGVHLAVWDGFCRVVFVVVLAVHVDCHCSKWLVVLHSVGLVAIAVELEVRDFVHVQPHTRELDFIMEGSKHIRPVCS